MPRLGSFCSDRVLRVPKLTSLRIVASIFFALISATIFGMSGSPRSPGRETFVRDDFGLGEFAEFCGLDGWAMKVGTIMPIRNRTSATAIFERNDLMRSTPKNLNLRTRETLSTQTLKGNEVGKLVVVQFDVRRVSFTPGFSLVVAAGFWIRRTVSTVLIYLTQLLTELIALTRIRAEA